MDKDNKLTAYVSLTIIIKVIHDSELFAQYNFICGENCKQTLAEYCTFEKIKHIVTPNNF